MVASRWQAFFFDAETKVKFEPWNYQQMAGLTNFYNDKHWSWIFITFDEVRQKRVIEIAENNRGQYTSYLKDQAIVIPDDVEDVWFKTLVRKSFYQYAYSFNGVDWSIINVKLDAAVLSDDYVLQTYGGFFTGAFVGSRLSIIPAMISLRPSSISATKNWGKIESSCAQCCGDR